MSGASATQTAHFLSSSIIRELGPKLGPILVQLGPDFSPLELPAFTSFLDTLPRDLHFAVEFRSRGWITQEIMALLTEHGVALVLSDGPWFPRRGMISLATQPTASFSYIRWMGPDRSLVDFSRIQVDRTTEIDEWSTAIRTLSASDVDVFGYMSNHFAGHAPASVRALQQRVGLVAVEPESIGEQISLF